MKTPIVINLFGGPGSGKSTGAAYIFSQLKMKGINCELITEYAKDKTWEKNFVALSRQEYVLGKQSFRMARCADKVDVIVTDSPLLLGIFYNTDATIAKSLTNFSLDLFNKYNNMNYMVVRNKPYNPVGRNQTQEEADEIGDKIEFFLEDLNVPYTSGLGGLSYYTSIVNDVISQLKSFDEENKE